MIRYICHDEEATKSFGETFATILEAGDFIGLNGDLGAGKTFLSKAIIKSLGVDDYITSPSYTIVNEYEGKLKVNHFDVYRIDDIDEMYEIGYEEYFFSDGLCLVEWSNMIDELLPQSRYDINIKHGDNFTSRIIEISGTTKVLEDKLEALNESFGH